MGKRSDFLRIARDNYATPARAVEPLLPWLPPQSRFIDPCCNGGPSELIDRLIHAGHVLYGAYSWPDDDARVTKYDIEPGVIVVTNPPYWGQPRDLHPLIENLSSQAVTLLLMSADWMHNKRSAEILHYRCRMIVSARRVKWIAGSEHTAKDNAAWYQFGPPRTGATPVFIGSGVVPESRRLVATE
jgi:hypothetical protein